MRKTVLGSFLAPLMLLIMAVSSPAAEQEIPVKDMVTLVDLGAGKCIPCKMMTPIVEKLKKEYTGRAAIIFIDVWEDSGEAKRFAVSAIPTQIFYDKNGKEVYRHQGFLAEDAIVAKLKELGVAEPREK